MADEDLDRKIRRPPLHPERVAPAMSRERIAAMQKQLAEEEVRKRGYELDGDRTRTVDGLGTRGPWLPRPIGRLVDENGELLHDWEIDNEGHHGGREELARPMGPLLKDRDYGDTYQHVHVHSRKDHHMGPCDFTCRQGHAMHVHRLRGRAGYKRHYGGR